LGRLTTFPVYQYSMTTQPIIKNTVHPCKAKELPHTHHCSDVYSIAVLQNSHSSSDTKYSNLSNRTVFGIFQTSYYICLWQTRHEQEAALLI